MDTTLSLRTRRAVSLIHVLINPESPSSCLIFGMGLPSGGHVSNGTGHKMRIFRAEKSYAVTQGKWYFEFEAVSVGEMRVGWARPNVHADKELGSDELAYVFNGCKVI